MLSSSLHHQTQPRSACNTYVGLFAFDLIHTVITRDAGDLRNTVNLLRGRRRGVANVDTVFFLVKDICWHATQKFRLPKKIFGGTATNRTKQSLTISSKLGSHCHSRSSSRLTCALRMSSRASDAVDISNASVQIKCRGSRNTHAHKKKKKPTKSGRFLRSLLVIGRRALIQAAERGAFREHAVVILRCVPPHPSVDFDGCCYWVRHSHTTSRARAALAANFAARFAARSASLACRWAFLSTDFCSLARFSRLIASRAFCLSRRLIHKDGSRSFW